MRRSVVHDSFYFKTFWPKYNLDLRSYGQLYYLFLLLVLPLFNKYILAYQWFSFVVRFFTSFRVSFSKDSIKNSHLFTVCSLTNLKAFKTSIKWSYIDQINICFWADKKPQCTLILNSCISHCMLTRRRWRKSTAVLCTTQFILDGKKLRPISLVSRAREI